MAVHLAVDIGAGSGRVIAGDFDGSRLVLEEVNRFANEGIRLPTGWHWNAPGLLAGIKRGLAIAHARSGHNIASLAVDTWGVDYGLLDARGRLLGLPWMYRDSRTDEAIEEASRLVPLEDIYRRTGIQFLPFNTLFQLFVETRQYPDLVATAHQQLFMPDLLSYWLSGERVVERTIASTSQLLKPGSSEWDRELATIMGIPARLLHPTTEPGTQVGRVLESVREETGCGAVQVVTCGGHDTASAVAGVPSSTPQPLFLSSGTWSLLGRELHAPLITAETYKEGFSNEQGLCGTTRFLRNVAGMWLLQECKRTWDAQGLGLGFSELVERAAQTATNTFLDPDDPCFAKPCDMPAAIRDYAQATGQPVPSEAGEITRIILESLALKYRGIVQRLRSWMPDLPDTLHIVGGGSQNALLNQMTATATGLHVVAGPVEATAAGNIIAQLMAAGEINTLEEGRVIIRASFPTQTFEPEGFALWEEKADCFRAVTGT